MQPIEELLDLKDETLGELTRTAMVKMMDEGALEDMDARTDLLTILAAQACAQVLIRCAVEHNATEATVEIEGYHLADKPYGNWRVSVERTDVPEEEPTPEELGYDPGEDLITEVKVTIDDGKNTKGPQISRTLTRTDGDGNERTEEYDPRERI